MDTLVLYSCDKKRYKNVLIQSNVKLPKKACKTIPFILKIPMKAELVCPRAQFTNQQ